MTDEEMLKRGYVNLDKLLYYLEDAIDSYSHPSLGQSRSAFRLVKNMLMREKLKCEQGTHHVEEVNEYVSN